MASEPSQPLKSVIDRMRVALDDNPEIAPTGAVDSTGTRYQTKEMAGIRTASTPRADAGNRATGPSRSRIGVDPSCVGSMPERLLSRLLRTIETRQRDYSAEIPVCRAFTPGVTLTDPTALCCVAIGIVSRTVHR